MQQHDIHEVLKHFFNEMNCSIIEDERGYFTTQLTVEMDKKLMNRPFYWHYLEKVGGEPNPMPLTLVTDQTYFPDDKKGEFVHFGAPRLHQIFHSIKEYGMYTRMYENVSLQHSQSQALHPWININAKIHYECDLKRDSFLSLGIHLVTGQIKEHFHDELQSLQLVPKIPDGCFTLSGMITPQSALIRLQKYMQQKIEAEDFTWAHDALDRMNYDLSLLDAFYENVEEKPDSYVTEQKAIQEQYDPSISVEILNGGFFYLKP